MALTAAAAKRTIAAWAAAVILALVFVGSGIGKLTASDVVVESFKGWGYPLWFMYVVGAAEVAGGVLVLLPRVTVLRASLRAWGGAGLAVIMVGAVGTHLVHGEYAFVGVTAALGAVAAALAWSARPGRPPTGTSPVEALS